MSKRYKEFLIDVIIKLFQLLLGIAVITPIVTQKTNLKILIPSIVASFIFIVWAGAIAAQMEE